MRIGELLIMNGLLSEEQVERALREQARYPRKLGEIFIESGMITERQLVEALEFQLGVPVVNLKETTVDTKAVQLVPKSLAWKYRLIPFDCQGEKVKLAMADPADQAAVQEVQSVCGRSVQPFIAIRGDVEEAVARFYGEEEYAEKLHGIIQAGVYHQASGIHFEPHETGLLVKYRIGGALKTQTVIPKSSQAGLIERIKAMAHLHHAEGKLPLTGRFSLEVGHSRLDVKVSTLPSINGELVYLQWTDQSEAFTGLNEQDFSAANLQSYEQALERPGGLVLVAGPAGSGKTSLLYSTVRHLKDEDVKAITVEDPIRRRLPGVAQVEVDEQSGLTLVNALRSALRHDPNVLMIDELRDAESLELAIRAALSGRSVLGAVYGLSAVKTLERLLGMGIDAFLLGSALHCVAAVRLVRRVCRQCAQTVSATDEEMKLFEEHGAFPIEEAKNSKGLIGNFRSFVSAQTSGKMMLTRGNGCRLCHETGYRGTVAVQEVLPIDDTLRDMIVHRRPLGELEEYVRQKGFRTLLHDGLVKVRDGLTTVEEIRKAVV